MLQTFMTLFGYKKIYIKLFDGTLEKTIVRPLKSGTFLYPKGTYIGYRFWFTHIGQIICTPDGKVSGACYVHNWSFR